MLHRNSNDGHNHQITNFTYADEAERLAATSYLVLGVATPFALADIGKTAKQGNEFDGYTFFVISNVADDGDGGVTVTWNSLGGGSGGAEIVAIYQVGGAPAALSTDHFHTAIVTRADINAVLAGYDGIMESSLFWITSSDVNAHTHNVLMRFYYLTGVLEVSNVTTTSAHYHTATPVKIAETFAYNGLVPDANDAIKAGYYLIVEAGINSPPGIDSYAQTLVLPGPSGTLTQVCFVASTGISWTRYFDGVDWGSWIGTARGLSGDYTGNLLAGHANTTIETVDGVASYVINLPLTDNPHTDFPLGGQVEIYNSPVSNTSITFAPGVTVTRLGVGNLTGTYVMQNGEKVGLTKLTGEHWLMETTELVVSSSGITIFEYADKAARVAITTTLTIADIGKLGKQLDEGSYWLLSDVVDMEGPLQPVWYPISFNNYDRIPSGGFAYAVLSDIFSAANNFPFKTFAPLSPNTFTIPAHADFPAPIGGVIKGYNEGTVAVTIAGAAGVTVRQSAGASFDAYTQVELTKIRTNEWLMTVSR